MTRNRKADLQRKLAMAPVATPPPDLAERIKREIPVNLEAKSYSWRTFNAGVAASIVLVAASLYLVFRLTAPMGSRKIALAKPAPVALSLPVNPPQPGSARPAQTADLPALPSAPPPAVVREARIGRMAEAKHEEAAGMSNGAPSFVDAVVPSAPKMEPEAIVNATPAAAPPPPPAAVAETLRVEGATAMRDRAMSKTTAAADVAAPPVRNFVAIQEAIARGESPRNVDTSAIVQHFAAPERTPAALRVELEASAAPLDATKWLLRVSVDSPAAGSAPIDVEFGDAVATHRPVTAAPAPNQTALYEIEFRPGAKRDQTIATVRAGNVENSIRVADLQPWNTASSRMKRASLAAAWAHTLQTGTQAGAIVAKARAEHIDDLADMAEQAERIR
jgi:hypothetical protein